MSLLLSVAVPASVSMCGLSLSFSLFLYLSMCLYIGLPVCVSVLVFAGFDFIRASCVSLTVFRFAICCSNHQPLPLLLLLRSSLC